MPVERRKRRRVQTRDDGLTQETLRHIEEHTSTRLASVEADVRHLGQSQDELNEQVSLGFRRLSAKIDEIAARSQITWPLIFTAIGSLVAMGTIGGLIHSMSLQPLYDGLKTNNKTLESHMSTDGHPAAMQLHAGLAKDVGRIDGDVVELKKSLKDQDAVLQREMRALDQVQLTRIDSLDTTLQREMRLLDDIQAAKQETLSAQFAAYSKQAEQAEAHAHDELRREQSGRIAKLEALLEKILLDKEQRVMRVRDLKKEQP